MNKLDEESKQIMADLKAAREAWLNADPGVKEDYKEAYEDLKRKDEVLDAMRKDLHAQLRPGVCMCVCAHCIIASTSAAPSAAV